MKHMLNSLISSIIIPSIPKMNYEFDGFVAFLPPILWVTMRVTRAFLAFVLSPENASPGGRELYCMRPVSIHELLGVRLTNLTWYFPRLRLVRSRLWLFFNNQLFQLFCFRKTYLATSPCFSHQDGLFVVTCLAITPYPLLCTYSAIAMFLVPQSSFQRDQPCVKTVQKIAQEANGAQGNQ